MDSDPSIRKASKPVTAEKRLDASRQDGQNVKFCNGRIKHDQNMKQGTTEKSKCSKTSSHSSNGNKVDGNCSSSNDMISVSKRTNSDSKRKLSARLEIDRPESSRSGDSYAQEPFSLPDGYEILKTDFVMTNLPDGYEILKTDFVKTNASENGKSSAVSNSRPQKLFQIKLGMNEQHTHLATSVPSVSRSSSAGSVNNLRSLKRNSLPHVSSSSSSSLSKSIGKNVMEKGIPERKSSSSRSGRNIPSTSNSSSSNSIRSIIVAGEVRNGYNQNTRSSSFVRGPSMGRPDTEMPGRSNSSQTSSANGYPSSTNSSNRACNTGDDPFTSIKLKLTDLQRRVALQESNVAEERLALKRMKEVEGLTYERLHDPKISFSDRGLRLYNPQRDLRLDIDNICEELLALEERMGYASLAVPEEAIEKCLNKSIYQTPPSPHEKGFDNDANDIKCSICQEEYAPGDEIGSLVECRHVYHVLCISKWLQLKNWCPICKAVADPSL